MISFKAQHLTDTNIQKRNFFNRYKDYQAAFIELNPEKNSDLETLKSISELWKKSDFAENIYHNAKIGKESESVWCRYYGLTIQKDSFEKIKPETILGIMEVRPMNHILQEINLIQVNPKYNLYSKNRIYKNIGTGLINSLKKLFPKKNIIVEPLNFQEIKNFYTKNGFVDIGEGFFKYFAPKI